MKKIILQCLYMPGFFLIGLSFPVDTGIIIESKPMLDLFILMPIGLILIVISIYYSYIKK